MTEPDGDRDTVDGSSNRRGNGKSDDCWRWDKRVRTRITAAGYHTLNQARRVVADDGQLEVVDGLA